MTALTTGSLNLPDDILDPWLTKVQAGSCLAALSNSIPMKFGKGHAMTWDIGEAEYVGEGANKGPSTATPTTMNVKPYKFHKTVRWTNEVKFADEDYQLDVISQILALIQPALSRALDFGGFHGINPTGGDPVVGMANLAAATQQVERVSTDKPYINLDKADELVLAAGYVPSDVALAPAFASKFATARGTQSEQKLYPDLKLTTAVSDLEGHRASVSRTVSAQGVAATDTKLLGVVGDLSTFGWGVQREIGLEMIEYGDPDGQGDLKRNNQVAFRSEIIYGWGVADLSAVALIVDKVAG
ncbi:phage major capsid protein [Mycolicibacterium nivoides]|uniref:Phage major capsid protein n=1 Tax=Mycolicibacterium nivoides TaxID=2487344 RepID=A0ABW9LA28_9MYCO